MWDIPKTSSYQSPSPQEEKIDLSLILGLWGRTFLSLQTPLSFLFYVERGDFSKGHTRKKTLVKVTSQRGKPTVRMRLKWKIIEHLPSPLPCSHTHGIPTDQRWNFYKTHSFCRRVCRKAWIPADKQNQGTREIWNLWPL